MNKISNYFVLSLILIQILICVSDNECKNICKNNPKCLNRCNRPLNYLKTNKASLIHCGISTFDEREQLITDRILNGDQAVNHMYPHMVSIQKLYGNNTYYHGCAGAILNSRYIITAAHCW